MEDVEQSMRLPEGVEKKEKKKKTVWVILLKVSHHYLTSTPDRHPEFIAFQVRCNPFITDSSTFLWAVSSFPSSNVFNVM